MQNIRTIRSCFILFLFVLVSCKGQTDKLNDNCPLIPKPLSLDVQPGEFTFGDSVVIELKTDDEEIKRAANFLKNAGIINRNRNNSASCTDNKRITLKISEIREIAI